MRRRRASSQLDTLAARTVAGQLACGLTTQGDGQCVVRGGRIAFADFSSLPAGAIAAPLPGGLSYARASDGHTVQTSETTLALLTAGNNVAGNGRRRAADALGLAHDPARANVLRNNLDPTAATWTVVGGSTTAGQADPAGGTNGYRMQCGSGAFANWVPATVLAASAAYVSTWWMSAGGGSSHQMIVTPTTAASGGALGAAGAFARYGFAATLTNPAMVPCDGRNWSGTAPAGIAAGARDATYYGAQIEAGGWASELIVTGAAAVTRAGSRLYWPAATTVVRNGRVALAVEFVAKCALASNDAAPRVWTSGADYCQIDRTTGVVTVSIGDITNTSEPLDWAALDRVQLFVAAGGGLATIVRVAVNAGDASGLPIDGDPLGAVDTSGALDVFSNGATQQLAGYIQTVAAYASGAPTWATSDHWQPVFTNSSAGFRDTDGIDIDRTSYRERAAGANVLLETDADALDVELYATDGVSLALCNVLAEVDGAGQANAVATALSTAQTKRITTPGTAGSTRQVRLTDGIMVHAAPPTGAWVRRVSRVGGSFLRMVPLAAAPTRRLIVYGNSITGGLNDSSQPTQQAGWVFKLRRDASLIAKDVRVSAIASANRGLFNDYVAGAFTALVAQIDALAASCATAGGVTVALDIGTNDMGLDLWSGAGGVAGFQAAYQTLLTDLRAALPLARIVAITPLVRTSGTPNGSGETIAQTRTAIANAFAAAALSNALLVDGTTLMTAGGLADDGVHPTPAGHTTKASNVAAGLYP